MSDILNSYLVQHKSISIPGMGTIYVEDVPARSDFVNRQLLPPFSIYRFDKYFDAPEREFFGYLASHRNMTDYEAIRWYNEFAYNLRAQIRNGGEAIWDGIGVFKQNSSGDIFFEEDRENDTVYEAVPAERIIRNESHAMRVGDNETTTSRMNELLRETVYVEKESWWIYALILAAIGICLAFLHFGRFGFNTGSIFK